MAEQAEQAPIPIESRVTRESEAGEADNGARGRRTSSGRVVHEPGRWPRFAAVVAIVGLVVGGLLWAALDGEPTPAGDEPASDRSAPPDDPRAETRRAFAKAMLRFEEVRSFAYSGSVQAAATRPFGAGASAVGDRAVEGAVLLPAALAREVTADGRGRVEETITSGTTVWTRSAASADTLDGAPWTVRPDSLEAGSTLDMQAVAHLITTAADARGEAPDFAGRRVIRATLPTRGDGAGNRRPLAGADVLLSLDHAEGIGHLVVTWPPRDPELVLDVEISGHNHPQDVTPPDRGPAALRRTVPIEALAADGVQPLELGRLPARWRLTGAWAGSEVTPRGECSVLNLVYVNLVYGDPEAGFGDYLWLRLAPQGCAVQVAAVGDPRPLTVGAFEGSVVESSSAATGALSDGTTGVRFETDLPVDHVATLLASLRTFAPDAEPEPLAGASTQ
ncbi:MAG: hypothetical protein ACRD07_10565 [Acidimicrobiales bacterium]